MRRHRGSRGGKEPGHDLARQPGRSIEARTRTESGQAVRAADRLRGRQAAAEPVADHGLHRFGLPSRLSPHSFRVTAITDVSAQGVPLEEVQNLAGHAEPRTTGLYVRRQKKVTRNIVERISILWVRSSASNLCRWVNTRQLSIALDVEPLDSTALDAERMFNRFVNQDSPFEIFDDLVNIGNK
jgi:Phage integrase family